jgi:hypothetical protein
MHFEGIYCFDRGVVRFAIFPMGVAGPRILADISEEALTDVFKVRGGSDSWLQGCASNFNVIAAAAITKSIREPGAQIRLESPDFHRAEPSAQGFNDVERENVSPQLHRS